MVELLEEVSDVAPKLEIQIQLNNSLQVYDIRNK